MDQRKYDSYVLILKSELKPALGCTEPIAIAYASAKARETLGRFPKRIDVQCSGNIIKNVKGVIVPGTKTMKGIETSAVLGALAGKGERELEVLSEVCEEDIAKTRELLKTGMCKVSLLESESPLHLIVAAHTEEHSAVVEVRDNHTNILRIELDGKRLFTGRPDEAPSTSPQETEPLTLRDIYEFVRCVNVEDISAPLSRQIEFNTKIAEEGLANSYGLNVGSSLIKRFGGGVDVMARAMPAAGSDARMSGCGLPVVISSGSGNQGMTASLPVIIFARHLGVSQEALYRGLAMSNLTAIHLKSGIGRLSAYCGVAAAACASGAAITYLHGGGLDAIERTVINTLGNVSGIVCDGAKPSCALKIASCVDAAVIAHYLSLDGVVIGAGEGIVLADAESTIRGIGRLARDGMRETDVEILRLMLDTQGIPSDDKAEIPKNHQKDGPLA